MKQENQESSEREDERSLRCRHCGCQHFYVIYTRRAAGGKLVRRREAGIVDRA